MKIYGNTIKLNDIRRLRWKEKRRVNVKYNKGEDRMDKVLKMRKYIAAPSRY